MFAMVVVDPGEIRVAKLLDIHINHHRDIAISGYIDRN